MLLPSRAALPAGFCPVLSVSCQTGETGSNSEAGWRWGWRGSRKGGGGGGVAFREKACWLIIVCVKQKDSESRTRGPWACCRTAATGLRVALFHVDAVICISQRPTPSSDFLLHCSNEINAEVLQKKKKKTPSNVALPTQGLKRQ